MDSASQVAPTSGSELPFLDGVLERVESELKQREQVGFLYFDVVEFSALTENYGADVSQRLLQSLSETLNKQRGKLFRDEDLIAVGGPAVDFFVIYLFSPPRRKESFAKSDLKLISNRVLQKLSYIINETAAKLGVDRKIDLRGGYTVLKYDSNVPVDRLVYEARKEAALKTELEEIMLTFVSNVSHELRTPLTCIKGYAETLLEGALSEPDLALRWMKVIHEEAGRLERLIRDLLDLSMIEAHQVEMHFNEVDLGALCKHTAAVLTPHGKTTGVTIEVDMPDNSPLWRADEDRLSQVITNLVDNAIKYSPANGVVTVKLTFNREQAEIEVVDRGTGIPEDELPRIFERFYRVEKGSAARFGGRGLGLSIAMHIVEAHGGELKVDSKLHEGTRFRVSLPAGDASWLSGIEEE
ncbi:ATP-binding protein [bacterium]|nr:ATP-binding protein [bacterium]